MRHKLVSAVLGVLGLAGVAYATVGAGHTGWVGDVHDMWHAVVDGTAGFFKTIADKAKHTTCHTHNDDCREDPHNTHCWDPDPWPQRCGDNGKEGFVCALNPQHPFCQQEPAAGCVGAFMSQHPACGATTTTTLPPQGIVARWAIGFNVIGVRLTNGACALRRFPDGSTASYNTTCIISQPHSSSTGYIHGAVEVGVHIPPMTITAICAHRTDAFDETVPAGTMEGVSHALLRNGNVEPASIVNATGGNSVCKLMNVTVQTGDIIQAGRDMEPFDCEHACPGGAGACDQGHCDGNAYSTVIEIFN